MSKLLVRTPNSRHAQAYKLAESGEGLAERLAAMRQQFNAEREGRLQRAAFEPTFESIYFPGEEGLAQQVLPNLLQKGLENAPDLLSKAYQAYQNLPGRDPNAGLSKLANGNYGTPITPNANAGATRLPNGNFGTRITPNANAGATRLPNGNYGTPITRPPAAPLPSNFGTQNARPLIPRQPNARILPTNFGTQVLGGS